MYIERLVMKTICWGALFPQLRWGLPAPSQEQNPALIIKSPAFATYFHGSPANAYIPCLNRICVKWYYM